MQTTQPLRLIRWLSSPGSRLSQRALHATVWTLGGKGFEHTLNYTRIIVLAHLLSPVDFGIMGIGLVAISALDTITLPGLQEALVQKRGIREQHLNTLWTLTILRTLATGVGLMIAAPFLAIFFQSPHATLVLQVLGVTEFLRGLVNPGILYFQKELEFHKKALNDLVPTAAEVVTAIITAVILQNVWALVFGFMAGRVMMVLVSYWSHPYRPRFAINKDATQELFSFGRWVYLARLVNFASTQTDSIILGRLLGPASLGFYQMAKRSAMIPLLEIHRGISAVAFPLYSKVQDDAEKLKKGFLRGSEAVSCLIWPLAVTLFSLAPEFVRVLLGDKWLPSVPAIQILAVAGALHGVAAASGGALFMGAGKPWLSFQMNGLRALAVVVTAFPLAMLFGLSGVAYAILLAGIFTFIFHIFHSFSILKLQVHEYLGAILPAVSAVILIALVIFGLKQVVDPTYLPNFVLILALVALSYVGFFLLMGWKFKIGPVTKLRQMAG